MANLRVFVSFEFEKDNDLRDSFYRQAQELSPHIIRDSSLRQAYTDEEWKDKARTAIRGCDVVVVLVGADTHNAPGVKTEVEIACQLGKPVLQVVPQKRPYQGLPYIEDRVRWKWTAINGRLDEIAASR